MPRTGEGFLGGKCVSHKRGNCSFCISGVHLLRAWRFAVDIQISGQMDSTGSEDSCTFMAYGVGFPGAQAQRIRVHSWLMVSASLACIYRSSTGPCSDMIKYIIALDTSLPLSATLKRLYEYHDSHQTTQAFTNQQSPNHHVRLLLKFTRMADERTV